MILDTKNMRLNNIDLTPKEYKLVSVLASGDFVTYDKICQYVGAIRPSVFTIRTRLKEKIKDYVIISKNGYGLKTETKIEIM